MQALFLCGIQFLTERDDIFQDLLPVGFHILPVIVEAVHPQIPEIDEGFEAQTVCHVCADLDQVTEECLQLRFVLRKPSPVCQTGRFPDLRVGIVHGFLELCQGMQYSVKGDLGGGNQVLVGGSQGGFLLQQGDDLR